MTNTTLRRDRLARRFSSSEERAEKVSALKKKLDDAVASLADEEVWETMLHTVYQFGTKYSFGNQMLIMVQCAERGIEPKLVMAYGARDKSTGWLSKGRCVRNGEKGIQIWAPNFRRPNADEIAKMESEGKKIRRDPDGEPSQMLMGYRIEHVFDISQTDGGDVEIPDPVIEKVSVLRRGVVPELLTGEDTTNAFSAIVSLVESAGYRFELGDCGGPNGYTDPVSKLVKVQVDMSPAQQLKTAVHELAHIECKHIEDMREYTHHRGRMETEAESVAFIVCGALGLSTEKYSAPYIRSWSNGDSQVIAEAASLVVHTAQSILASLASL